jgi:hypothetical protein
VPDIRVIRLKYATLTFTEWGCVTRFETGEPVPACPHDTPDYRIIAMRLGHGDDILEYCRWHEACHLLAEERLHDRPSRVLWGLAHGQRLSGHEAAYEELAAQQLQAWLRAGQRPIVSGVDWHSLKRDALALLEPAEFALT